MKHGNIRANSKMFLCEVCKLANILVKFQRFRLKSVQAVKIQKVCSFCGKCCSKLRQNWSNKIDLDLV